MKIARKHLHILSTYKWPASDFMACLEVHGDGIGLGLEVHLYFIVLK